MSHFKEIKPEDFQKSPFQMIGKEWMLITAGNREKVNTMTASWGGLGVLWAKNAAFIVVRDSRFTKTFIDAEETFSLSFLKHEEYGKELSYLGKISGRDEDKIQKMGLHVEYSGETPYFSESSYVLICRKMSAQKITPDSFLLPHIDPSFYADKDYHTLYVGEVLQILEKE